MELNLFDPAWIVDFLTSRLFGVVPYWCCFVVLVGMYLLDKATSFDTPRGRVVGIVGRMGSGKSYMAIRIAYRRMLRGATIVTNFSMNLECPPKGHRRRRCPCRLAPQWRRFTDWPDLLEVRNAVIILDEADLFAPSHDYYAITDEVRAFLKMCRKYKLDVYWIAQHESRVNRILRDVLTNEIASCKSYFNGKYFTVRFYDPESKRKGKPTFRKGYFLNVRIANLYDTLEAISGSAYSGDETMEKHNERVVKHETNRIVQRNLRRLKPCEHERRKKARAGTCKECHPNHTENPDPLTDTGVLEVEEVSLDA